MGDCLCNPRLWARPWLQEAVIKLAKLDRALLRMLLVIVAYILCLACSCNRYRETVIQVSLCDLRNNQEQYSNKLVQLKGWVYSDLERFVLEDANCVVAMRIPAPATGAQLERFEKLFQEAKKGGFNTSDDVFAVIVGRFLTVETRIGNDIWTPGVGHGQSPSLLLVQQVTCSTLAPMANHTEAEATSRCRGGL